MASRALISQLLVISKDVAVVASCGDHEGTAGDGPKRRLGSGIGLSRSRQPLSNRDAVSRGEGPHNGDCEGVWRGPIRLSWLADHGGFAAPPRQVRLHDSRSVL